MLPPRPRQLQRENRAKMSHDHNLSRVIVIIAHRLGWISFVRPELIKEYLRQTPAVPATNIAALAGAALGIAGAFLDGSWLIGAPADLQSTLAIRIMFTPTISALLAYLTTKVTIAVRDKWSNSYRELADLQNQGDSPSNNTAALIGQVGVAS